MPDGGDLVLRHLAEACGQVVAHGLNHLSPEAQRAVADALESGAGDIELHVMGLNPLSLLVEYFAHDSLHRVTLFRVVPDADGGDVRDRRFN